MFDSRVAFGIERTGQRIAGVAARHGGEHQRGVGHVSRHGTLNVISREPYGSPVRRHQTRGAADGDDAAESGGDSEAAPGVGAGADRHHVAGERDGGSARGSAAGTRGVEGIARRAVDLVDGVGAGAEFRRVGLAERDGAGASERRHNALVLVRDMILVDE